MWFRKRTVTRHPNGRITATEETSLPSLDELVQQEWSAIKQQYAQTNNHSMDRAYSYVKNNWYAEAQRRAEEKLRQMSRF